MQQTTSTNNAIDISGDYLNQEVSFQLYDHNSEIKAKGKFIKNTEINVSSFLRGRYILKIFTKYGIQSKHIVIE